MIIMDFTEEEINSVYQQLGIATENDRQKYLFGSVIDLEQEEKYIITSGTEMTSFGVEDANME